MVALVLHAGPIEARTISEAVQRGLTISPEIRAVRANEAAADTDVSIAKGGYYPSVSVSGGPQSIDLDGVNYDITAAQMLYDWGRVKSTVDSAKAASSKLSEQAAVKRDEVALDIVEAYLDIMVTQRQVATVEDYIGILDGIRQMTAARASGNYADRSEPERAQLEMARAQEQLAIEKGTLADARNRYRLLVGEEPANLVEPAPRSMATYIGEQTLDTLIRASPLYRTATADVRTAEANLKQAKAALLPQLNLEATTLRRAIGGTAQTDTIVGLRFRMTTLQGFSNFLRPRGEQQRVQAAVLAEDTVERDTRRQVRTLLDNGDMMRARETALRVQVGTSGDVGQTYLEQFTVGRRDLIDILNTRREHFDAERQLTTVHFDLIRVQFRAAAQLGLIGPLLEGRLG